MAQSSIEWTESTWNPVTGCDKISLGCDHCYAERLSMRLKAMGQENYANGFQLILQPHMLELPLRWKKSHARQRKLQRRRPDLAQQVNEGILTLRQAFKAGNLIW